MNREYRDRFWIPLLAPLGIVASVLVIIFFGSRILLEVPTDVAVPLAMLAAVGILLASAYLAVTPSVSAWQLYLIIGAPMVFLVVGGLAPYVHPEGATAPSPAGTEVVQSRWVVVATDNKFDLEQLATPAGQEFIITMRNDGAAPHNVHIYERQGGPSIAVTSPDIITGGQSGSLTTTINSPGTYFYQCDFHPLEMRGTLTVVAR